MFNIGFGELAIICIVLIIAVGPERLPSMMKTLGKTIRTLRQASRDIRASTGIDELLREDFDLYSPPSPPRRPAFVPPTPDPAAPALVSRQDTVALAPDASAPDSSASAAGVSAEPAASAEPTPIDPAPIEPAVLALIGGAEPQAPAPTPIIKPIEPANAAPVPPAARAPTSSGTPAEPAACDRDDQPKQPGS
jgi:sec-independent protein translocase protein TatB